jgi:hypothetical protein
MRRPLSFGLALTAGAGLILMMLALSFGVVQGAQANSSVIGLTFVSGLLLLLVGFGGWLAVVQPHKHFDDINVPQYTGHHETHGDEHALLPEGEHDAHAIIPHE